jgi:hypothetical protein
LLIKRKNQKKKSIKEAELRDFKRKIVPGLYNFDHFEAEDGSFIQISPHGHGVYRDVTGKMNEFDSMDQLKMMFNKTEKNI